MVSESQNPESEPQNPESEPQRMDKLIQEKTEETQNPESDPQRMDQAIQEKKEETKKKKLEANQQIVKAHSDHYFIENLHFMYDKKTLMFINGKEGAALNIAHNQKSIIEGKTKRNELIPDVINDEFFTALINMLKDMFEKTHSHMQGGGTLDQLKNSIRKKIKQIVPR